MKHLKSNWMSNLKTQNEALADLILGILIFGILVVFVGLFVAPDKAAFVLGAVLGTATSVIRAVHMAVTLDRQLDYGEKDARAYAARNYGIRYLIMIAVLLVSTRLGVSGMAGAVIGLFSMKPAAILRPLRFTSIFIPEFLAKEGEVMGNEVDFMVHGYVPLNIFGHEVWLTTTHVCLLIVCLFMLVIGLIVNNKMKHATEVPGMVQNIAELYVEMMDGVVQSSMFRHWGKYANYILTIFMFLLFSNISGLFGLRPPTADYGVTLPLALITFVLIQFNAFKWKGVGGYVKDLMDPIPLFLPINIISEFATPVSLSLRLFGNVMAGTIMLALYYGMLPVLATVVIPSFLHAYLDLFSGAIQAYVFCMLSMTFIYQKMPE